MVTGQPGQSSKQKLTISPQHHHNQAEPKRCNLHRAGQSGRRPHRDRHRNEAAPDNWSRVKEPRAERTDGVAKATRPTSMSMRPNEPHEQKAPKATTRTERAKASLPKGREAKEVRTQQIHPNQKEKPTQRCLKSAATKSVSVEINPDLEPNRELSRRNGETNRAATASTLRTGTSVASAMPTSSGPLSRQVHCAQDRRRRSPIAAWTRSQ